MKNLHVELIPAFSDNYFFAIKSLNSNKVSIIDPGSAAPIISYLEKNNLILEAIFVTHHHSDHVGGVQELKEKYKVKLYGPSSVNPDEILKESSVFKIDKCEFQVMHLPGHTLDHLVFYQREENLLFCGDVLFSLGCGRLFEGTFEQMFHSLSRLKALPSDTNVYCAHEYTLHNLDFSLSYLEGTKVRPYKEIQKELLAKREKNIPTVPSTIGFEQKYNLFLRAQNLEEFKKIRQARNNF